MRGTRDPALPALLADPMTHSATAAESTSDELLAVRAPCLPQLGR